MKLIVGAAATGQQGWMSTDINSLDVTNEKSWARIVGKNLLTHILAEHVWEHLSEGDARIGARLAFKYLCARGRLRIAVPDANFPHRSYLDSCKVKPDSDHKVFYTVYSLTSILESVGFNVRPLEYFDFNGKFHLNEWCRNDGLVKRSLINDSRNVDGTFAFTSLIVDAHKH